jgi:hypothetical protein
VPDQVERDDIQVPAGAVFEARIVVASVKVDDLAQGGKIFQV